MASTDPILSISQDAQTGFLDLTFENLSRSTKYANGRPSEYYLFELIYPEGTHDLGALLTPPSNLFVVTGSAGPGTYTLSLFWADDNGRTQRLTPVSTPATLTV